MKKNNFLFFIIVAQIGIMMSCQKDELVIYDVENHNQIFYEYAYEFQSGNNIIDNTYLSFGYDKITKVDSVVSVPVRIMGGLAEYDREFKYMIVDTSSTAKEGVNYDILMSYIPANNQKGEMKIKLYNTEDLKDTTFHICVRLIPNEYFSTDFDDFYYSGWGEDMNPLEYYVYFDSKDEIPNLWAAYSSWFENYCFGPYSRVKFNFALTTLGLEREFFMYDVATENAATVMEQRLPQASRLPILYGWMVVMNNALDAYEVEHGERLKDENGVEVTMRRDYK